MGPRTGPPEPGIDAPATGPEAQAVIRVRGLTKRFPHQLVFENLDLDVWRGEILGLVGASGQGKSVLLRCLTGLEPTQAGRIEIFGRDAARLSRVEQIDTDGRWGVLFQDGALFGALTVLQNIQVPMREQLDLPKDTMDELACLKLALVGLPPDAAHKFPSELSGGMRKRAALARALALDPEILLLDEPGAGLDPVNVERLDELVANLRHHLGTTVVMVTHEINSVFEVADRALFLDDQAKTMTAIGTPQDLRDHGPDAVRLFLRHGGTRRAA